MKKLAPKNNVGINMDWFEKEVYFRNYIKKLIVVTIPEYTDGILKMIRDNPSYFKESHVLHLT